eukprot:SAG31_NODE_1629_length_7702_cov_6.380902_7_plen_204_part_00
MAGRSPLSKRTSKQAGDAEHGSRTVSNSTWAQAGTGCQKFSKSSSQRSADPPLSVSCWFCRLPHICLPSMRGSSFPANQRTTISSSALIRHTKCSCQMKKSQSQTRWYAAISTALGHFRMLAAHILLLCSTTWRNCSRHESPVLRRGSDLSWHRLLTSTPVRNETSEAPRQPLCKPRRRAASTPLFCCSRDDRLRLAAKHFNN